MQRRIRMDRLNNAWAGLCLWFLRCQFLPPDRSIRLVTWLSFLIGLPCPIVARARA